MRWRRGAHAPRVPFPAPTPESPLHTEGKFISSVAGGGADHSTRGRVRSPIRTDASGLQSRASDLLRSLGADELARKIRVEWNPRMRTCAGRADYREKVISLNPLLFNLGDALADTELRAGKLDRLNRSSSARTPKSVSEECRRDGRIVCDEVDRTLRHELAHLLAQWRVGRRRIAPHGAEWRQACRDLGIGDEARCHNLPFATKAYSRRYVYRCPNCKEEFPRVRRIRRAIACLACCHVHNQGEFDSRFRLRLARSVS